MAYQALYRKWRPAVFEDVVGQNHIVETLKNQIINNKTAHAYLFCGSRGTGKTSTAKIFSRAINCEHPINGNPCNECATCKGINNGSIFDVVEIDGASNNKVDDVRNIRDEVVYPPADCKYKVYIIDEVHMLTTEAFNALLKTLEEPPSYVVFILATTEFHKIPATIISRCQKYDFKRITYNDTATRIKIVAKNDGIDITDSAVKLISKAADGSLRDGLSKLDQCIALGIEKIDYKDVANIIGASDPDFLASFCDAIIYEDLGKALKLLDEGVNKGLDALRLYTDVIDYFRDIMMIKTSKDYSLIINNEEDVIKRYEQQADNITLSRLLRIIDVLFEGQSNAKYSVSPKLSFETALLKVASSHTDNNYDAMLDRINILEEKLNKILENGVIPSDINVEKEEYFTEEIQLESDDNTSEEYIDNENIVDEIKNDIQEEEIVTDEVEEEYNFADEYDNNLFDEEQEGFLEFFKDDISAVTPEEETINEEVNDVKVEINISEDKTEEIYSNFKEILSNMPGKDFGFDNIVSSAKIVLENNSITLYFNEKSKFDIAKSSGYDTNIKEYIRSAKNADVNIKLKMNEEEKEINIKKDPMDDLFDIAEQNQMVFKIED